MKIRNVLFATLMLPMLFLAVPASAHLNSTAQSEIITNPLRSDGFGGQFQTIIYAMIYAELNNMPFRYTPFRKMEHNYDNDAEFLKDKEQLINFIGNFEVNENLKLQSNNNLQFILFFEANFEKSMNSQSMKKIKEVFWSNKNKEDYFDAEKFNVAVHVRRPNSHDTRIYGSNTPDRVYLKTIDLIRNKYSSKKPLFHIYSQGDIKTFEKIYAADDVVLHIDESIEQTFTSLVLADVLVTSSSSLSYTAGILSDGEVYYMPFWHPALPGWITIEE
jgi:hypothetical protein